MWKSKAERRAMMLGYLTASAGVISVTPATQKQVPQKVQHPNTEQSKSSLG